MHVSYALYNCKSSMMVSQRFFAIQAYLPYHFPLAIPSCMASGISSIEVFAHLLPIIRCRFHDMLKPGGRLLITDYCRSSVEPSSSFAAYISQRGYHLHPVEEYGNLLSEAGFYDVKAEDRTWQVLTDSSSPPPSIQLYVARLER